MNDNPYVLCQKLGALCIEKNITIALAESCTGGLLSAWITQASGVSHWFYGSACVYSNAAKTAVLGVDAALIKKHGAVSDVVAEAMAKGVYGRYQSTLSLSITGIAGPQGGTPIKPVGTVYLGLHDHRDSMTKTRELHLESGRTHIRESAAIEALHWMIAYLGVTE